LTKCLRDSGKKKKNHRTFFDWLGKQLGFYSFEDWYSITTADIYNHGGKSGLSLDCYNYSIVSALVSIYPEYHWLPWKFSKTPKGIWKNNKYIEGFLNDISKLLNISKLDDWYRVSQEDLLKYRGAVTFVRQRGGLMNILSEAYPNHQWDPERFQQRSRKSSQWQMYKIIKELLPSNIEVFEEFICTDLAGDSGLGIITLDVYIPALKLAFEYQGHQHYHDHSLYGPFMVVQQRDDSKRGACKSLGITIIEVPYWWQRDKETIIAELRKHRPDIVDGGSLLDLDGT